MLLVSEITRHDVELARCDNIAAADVIRGERSDECLQRLRVDHSSWLRDALHVSKRSWLALPRNLDVNRTLRTGLGPHRHNPCLAVVGSDEFFEPSPLQLG